MPSVSVTAFRTRAAPTIMAIASTCRISVSEAPSFFAPAKWRWVQWAQPPAAAAARAHSSRVLGSRTSSYSNWRKA